MYTAAALALLSVLVGHGDNPRYVQPGKPVRPEPINTYFKAPPDTLSQMIAQADLVVRGRIVGERPRDATDIAITRTGYRLRVLEIVHLSPQHSIANADLNEVEIVRSGGIRDRGRYTEQSYQVGFPSFDIGTPVSPILIDLSNSNTAAYHLTSVTEGVDNGWITFLRVLRLFPIVVWKS